MVVGNVLADSNTSTVQIDGATVGRLVGDFTDYDGLVEALRTRIDAVGLSHACDLARIDISAKAFQQFRQKRSHPIEHARCLSRTLLRLRHDFVILGRAAAVPLPYVFAQRLRPRLTELATEASKFLRDCATALTRRRNPGPLDTMDKALQAYVSEVVAMRREGLTRALSIEEAERVFTLAFALEQLYRNFSDLERCVKEHAAHYAGRRAP
jgi:hypothetical protein